MASERYAIINISGHAVVVTCLRTPKKLQFWYVFSPSSYFLSRRGTDDHLFLKLCLTLRVTL